VSKNKVLIDIGTHQAQELRVLVGDRYYIGKTYFHWWYDWLKRQIKKIIGYDGIICYGEGAFITSPADNTLKEHIWYLRLFLTPNNCLSNFKAVMIDPVVEVTVGYYQRLKDKFLTTLLLPVAILPHEFVNEAKMVKFYIEKNSLSSSLFDSGKSSDLIVCPGYSFDKIISELMSEKILDICDEIILRLNCEGAELGVVKSLLDQGIIPSLILGSINDVLKKYGEEVASELNALIEANKIEFFYFKGSDPGTWKSAFKAVENL